MISFPNTCISFPCENVSGIQKFSRSQGGKFTYFIIKNSLSFFFNSQKLIFMVYVLTLLKCLWKL